MIALARSEIEVNELKWKKLIGGGGERFQENGADPALGVDGVLDVEMAPVGLVDGRDKAFAVAGAVVVEDDVVGESVLEGEEVVGV